MSAGKFGVPSAPQMDHDAVVMTPPPSYDETMGMSSGYPPRPQYSPQFPYPPQQYPVEQQNPTSLPYPTQPYYRGPGFATAQGRAECVPRQPVQLQNVVTPAANLQYIPVGAIAVGPKPITTMCPACRVNVRTTTVMENKLGAHLACGLMCLIGAWCCCFIPYCLDSCKKVRHTCPNCGISMGLYTP